MHGLDLKDLDKLARNIGKFNPSLPNSQNVHAYLQDIDFHLEMRPNVTDKDKLYLLRTTSSPEVRSFLDRQPVNTKTYYQRLQKALIKEFADPEFRSRLSGCPGDETRTSRTLLKLTTVDSDKHILELVTNLTWKRNWTLNSLPEEPSSWHKPPSWRPRMPTNNEHSAVARLGAKSLRQTKDGLRKERKTPSSSWFQHSTPRTGAGGHPTPRQC